MSDDDTLRELLVMIQQLDRHKEIYRAEHYSPYPFQERFHYAEGYKTPGKLAVLRALMAGNQVGKSLCGCVEDSYHCTGRYPDWWKGHRMPEPINMLVCGITNESVRDILQKELFGDPTDPKALGTGTIPIDCIGKITRKAGIPNAFDSVKVRNVTGRWSTIYLRAYEQGFKKFMGTRYDVVHADEEPPMEIFEQLLRSMFSRKNAIGYITFTPEEGLSEVVDQFMNNPSEGQALITAGWEDAPHMMKDGKLTDRARIFAANLPKHSLQMRMNGTPLSGAGLVFDIPDEQIVVRPFEIPKYWPQLRAMDFGSKHPFAAVHVAYDRDADCIYLCHEYRESKALPAVHVQAMNAWGEWIPTAWPHDGVNDEKSTGDELIKSYRDAKLLCLPTKVTNPPEPGKEEGTGGNSVEASILDMVIRFETGRLKIFSTCGLFLSEKRSYHRKKGLIVKINDDVVSALRYACMGIRHAVVDKPKQQGNIDTTRGGTQYTSARPKRRK